MKSIIEEIELRQLVFDETIYPRLKPDEELVLTYKNAIEDGANFPPIILQQGTYRIIDGVHRYLAYTALEYERVNVEFIDIPDPDCRAESIRRNVKQGSQLKEPDLRYNIIKLRFIDSKPLHEIASIVGRSEGRISQICNEYKMRPRDFQFKTFNPKDLKIDLRQTVDSHKREKILQDLRDGKLGKDIAKDHNVSEATVSKIKTDNEDWLNAPLYFKLGPSRLEKLLKVAFGKGLYNKARFMFRENGVVVKNSGIHQKENTFPYMTFIAQKTFFPEYRLKKPIDGYADDDIIDIIKKCKGTDHIEVALLDSQTWKFRYTRDGAVKTKTFTNELTDRDFEEVMKTVTLDEHGIPDSAEVNAQISYKSIPLNEKGIAQLKLIDKELVCHFKCRHGADCTYKINMSRLEKAENATATFDMETYTKIVSAIRGPVYIGMWRDLPSLAIGLGDVDNKLCFILGN